ncbi:hypothetical protein HPG69_008676 [Diceros bicornis minor]|uniref:Uncharacterized protein n=1 Tax=Diceros bicornis minor TaxID=77932 RepID=A0A7J7FAF3_DICBM|nr:hypothetical protein HPG69_008676 [Diceros bicornis minor]
MDWRRLGTGLRGAGTTSERANGVPRVVAAGFGSVRKGESCVSGQHLGCGVRNKNGKFRRWGRRMDSTEGALGRRQDCARQGHEPGPSEKVLSPKGLWQHRLLSARASLPRRLRHLVVITRGGWDRVPRALCRSG